MSDQDTDDAPSSEENDCQKPCDPATSCPYCADYWERMRAEGYWIDGKGWTNKGMREMLK